MSANYGSVMKHSGNVPKGIIINGTALVGQGGTFATTPAVNTVGSGSYIFGVGTLFKVLRAQVRINTAGASATQSFRVQLSDSAGSFASPTTLATVTILSSNAAGSLLSADVAANSTDVDNSNGTNLYAVRLVHVATSTDASLDYDYIVYYTYPHC